MGITPYPAKGLRHSFCSYHLAMYEDSAKTAFHAGHASVKTTYENYFQLVKKTEAEKYWQLTPETTKPLINNGLTKADLERNLGMTT
jgi:integrase